MNRPMLVLALLGAAALAVFTLGRSEPMMACEHPGPARPTPRVGPGDVPPDQVAFAGRAWAVRDYDGPPTSVGSWDRRLVSIRDDGALVLRQARMDGQWASSEIYSVQQGFGYGTYRWVVESAVHDLDPQVVLGFFTYDRSAPGNNEIDLEFARWGRPDGDSLHYTVWGEPNFTRSWPLGEATSTEHLFTWSPGQVTWCSQDAEGREIARAEAATDLQPGSERVHMNLWISGGTAPGAATEVAITDFSFSPADAAGTSDQRS